MDHTRSMDDFEIEVIDLADVEDTGRPQGSPVHLEIVGAGLAPTLGGGRPAETGPPSLSRPLRAAVRSRRRRILQATCTISVVVMALVGIMGSYAPTRAAVAQRLASLIPTPTPALAPGSDLFYIQKTLSWSAVSLDGHTLPRLPIMRVDPPLRLTRGSHELGWHADPFQVIRCSISVPAANGDTCLSNDITRAPAGMYVKVIIFQPSLSTLPAAQRGALVQVAQAALDSLQSSETVQPGEYFFFPRDTGRGQAPALENVTATQPLQATLRFQLDTDASYFPPCLLTFIGRPCTRRTLPDCRLFCTTLPGTANAGEKSWDVLASIRAGWRFTTAAGQVITQYQPAVLIEHLVALHITWDGAHWHASLVANSPITNTDASGGLACTLARDKINLNGAYHFAEGDFNKTVNWFFASGPHLAAGCVAVATLAQHSAGASAVLAYCLYRFGVLLALNETARLYWPLMPLADAYEHTLAAQIEGRTGTRPPPGPTTPPVPTG